MPQFETIQMLVVEARLAMSSLWPLGHGSVRCPRSARQRCLGAAMIFSLEQRFKA